MKQSLLHNIETIYFAKQLLNTFWTIFFSRERNKTCRDVEARKKTASADHECGISRFVTGLFGKLAGKAHPLSFNNNIVFQCYCKEWRKPFWDYYIRYWSIPFLAGANLCLLREYSSILTSLYIHIYLLNIYIYTYILKWNFRQDQIWELFHSLSSASYFVNTFLTHTFMRMHLFDAPKTKKIWEL